MRIFLDNCVFNRPFDDQSAERIRAESLAVEIILDKVSLGMIDLLWSTVIDFENEKNPSKVNREWIRGWREFAIDDISVSENILERSKHLVKFGFGSADAIHISSAIAGSADFFVTTDDRILKKSNSVSETGIVSPVEFIAIIGEQ